MLFLCTAFFTLCSGFVLISSTDGTQSEPKLFAAGRTEVFQWKSTVVLGETEQKYQNVGFSISGRVEVCPVWSSGTKKLLKLEVAAPQLHVKSRKVPEPDGFIPHASLLDSHAHNPVYLEWNQGSIDSIWVPKSDPVSLKNLKKGIASLFQFKFTKESGEEVDPAGLCATKYSTTAPKTIQKSTFNCTFDPVAPLMVHTDSLLGARTRSTRTTTYTLMDTSFMTISSKESHVLQLQVNEALGSTIEAEQLLQHQQFKQCPTAVEAASIEEAVAKAASAYVQESLVSSLDEVSKDRKRFSKEVDGLRDHLKAEHLGNVKAAKAFLQLLKLARESSSEDISKALASKKNLNILPQLYDILGYAQTKHSHQAAMKNLHLDSEDHTDLVERYLWALSFSTHPNINILDDLLNKYRKYTSIPEPLRTTVILSLASMARTIREGNKEYGEERRRVLKSLEETILNGLDYAQDEDKNVFFNAIKNLRSPSTMPKLIGFLRNGTQKEEVLAWRAIKAFGKSFWTDDLLVSAKKTLLQLDRRHDTSARALAADILLGVEISDQNLEDLLNFVASNDKNFEIRQYVMQSIKMLADKCPSFHRRLQRTIRSNKHLNNYSSLVPRGLSTALTRTMFQGTSSNGSLVSIQEIKGGIVKRGAVDVVLDKHGVAKELFTLGIFAGGLSSFTSSDQQEEEDGEPEESATAGMELTVLGTQIRPFVFFDGQGELMGHVWAGTASEMTPAFQALILVQDHEDHLRLGNGFLAKVVAKGATSFDLSGKIQVSIWNRNAQSLIEKSVGFTSTSVIKVDTSFVQSTVQSDVSLEPKLSLEIDADFSSGVKLCMRLSQPDAVFRHEVTKLETVPGSRHKLKITKNRKVNVPGTTYALNRKNDEMCSAIFS